MAYDKGQVDLQAEITVRLRDTMPPLKVRSRTRAGSQASSSG